MDPTIGLNHPWAIYNGTNVLHMLAFYFFFLILNLGWRFSYSLEPITR